ncbi:MAG TPA: pyruvate formate-lyase-activating protein [Rickettsiales bacterium]|nr:pyruvate formate-lyase-activating protein [Rickettsiales bacterium]
MVKGYISAVETFGTVDGPGVRYVLFLQGCPLRCKYCHNRDMWNYTDFKKSETPQETVLDVLKYKNYIKNGGITLSGGEPLLQLDYCLELFKLLKSEGIHTALDTSGYVFNDKVKEILNYTDLVLLDIKSINPKVYKELTSVELENTLLFLDYLKEIGKKVWIRHVVVPTITFNEKDLEELAEYLTNYKDIIEKVELLPYHTMGIIKWEKLGEYYPLKNLSPLSKEELSVAKNIFAKYGFK